MQHFFESDAALQVGLTPEQLQQLQQMAPMLMQMQVRPLPFGVWQLPFICRFSFAISNGYLVVLYWQLTSHAGAHRCAAVCAQGQQGQQGGMPGGQAPAGPQPGQIALSQEDVQVTAAVNVAIIDCHQW